MLDLRDLIIERIDESNDLATRLSQMLQQQVGDSMQQEFQVNRKMLHTFSVLKRRQKQRIQRELELLQQTKKVYFWQPKVMQQFLSISLTIFSRYSSSFLSLLESGLSTAEQLRRLYIRFAELDHPAQLKKQIQKGQFGDWNPSAMLGWVCEWSRNRLGEHLQKAMALEFQRHEQKMKRISSGRGNQSGHRIINPLSVSTQVNKSNQNIPQCVFTNKESVYGLFLDQLNQYYKGQPLELDLDFAFVKGMRKVHSKVNDFQREENLQRAVEVLVEAKNKHIKEQIQQFRMQHQGRKHPKVCRYSLEDESKLILSHSQPKIQKKKKKVLPSKDNFIERIKSESTKGEGTSIKRTVSKTKESLLLCPKTKEISFQNSKQILKELKKQRQKKQLQLPQIMQSRFVGPYSKSTASRQRPINFLAPVSKSLISNYEKALLRSSGQVSLKYYEFKQPYSIQKMLHKNNFSLNNETRLEIMDNPETPLKKIEGDEFKRNRKLMLQLLRQKNKQALMDK